MGNICGCVLTQQQEGSPERKAHKRPSSNQSAAAAAASALANSSSRWTRSSTRRRDNNGAADIIAKLDDATMRDQAIAAAAIILRQQRQGQGQGQGQGQPFDRSNSLRYPSHPNDAKKGYLPRSSSSRPPSLADPLLQPHQLVNQDVKLDDLETNHFVLVHGGGFGAWCWYKTIALLEAGGFKVTAVELTGSGIHSFDTNGITTLSQYVKPLTDYLEKLPDGEKVILVGHDFGGACISYAMELLPSKVAKAVYVAAAMLISGQSALDIFTHKESSNDLMQRAQIFLYAKGNDNPPTAIDLDKSLLRDLLFNQSPGKDVALASVAMRPIPFAPVLEKLSLSKEKYGCVRRFYVKTVEDNAMPVALQEQMVNASPPEKVFRVKGADHSPFFSKPQALHKILVEIAKLK
ncbi:Putative methylesterase 11, chloroplastic [Dionaea muscipula]